MAAIEAVAEEVATNLEEVAAVTRRINASSVGYVLGGLVVGVAVGVYLGRRWNKEKIRAEVFEESKIEVDKIREAYLAREKPSIEELVEERGYSQKVEEDIPGLGIRPLPAPVPGVVEPVAGTIVPHKPKVDTWNYEVELRERTPEEPYVIHQDEFNENKTGYSHVVYTYYAIDDVVTDDDDEPVPHGDLIVGQTNLKFGHGSDDENVVFIRNERLEIEIELCRVHKSFEEEVLGFNARDDDSA